MLGRERINGDHTGRVAWVDVFIYTKQASTQFNWFNWKGEFLRKVFFQLVWLEYKIYFGSFINYVDKSLSIFYPTSHKIAT